MEMQACVLLHGKVKVCLLTMQQLEQQYMEYGFAETTVDACRQDSPMRRNTLSVYDEYSFGLLSLLNQDTNISSDRAAFYIQKDLLLFINIADESGRIETALQQTLEHAVTVQNSTMERVLYFFLYRVALEQGKQIEELEQELDQLDKRVLDELVEGFNAKIGAIRKELLNLNDYYDQFATLGEDLMGNENDLFGEGSLRYFKLLCDRSARLLGRVQLLRETAAQVRESYQEQLDISLNRTMKVFTVITAVFLPLTLLTSWYGMNFANMPELRWEYGYVMVMIMAAMVAMVCLFLFKKKNFM